MKLARVNDYERYDDIMHIFAVNEKKRIHIYTEKDHSITDVFLVNTSNYHVHGFQPKGLWYLENVTDDDGALDVDSLMIMIAQEEHGCVRA